MSTVRRVVNWFGGHDGAVAAAIFLLSLALYVLTMAPSVVAGDGGEMQTVSAVLGVAHPTGYPLFTLLGWLFTHLPLGGDPAYRVTLLSAVAAAGTVACLYLLLRELAVRRLAALLAAALVAVMPAIWLHAIVAGVYTLAHFFIILGLWTLLRWGHGKTPLWVPALVFGFGLTHHISLRLFGPAVLVYIIAVEPRLPLRPRRWLPALACLLLPFVVYAYIPLRAAHFASLPAWSGEIVGVRKLVAAGYINPHYFGSGLLGLIAGGGYLGDFLRGHDVARTWAAVREYLNLNSQQFPLVVIPIAVLGIPALFRRDAKAGWLLLLSYLTVLFAAVRFLAATGEDGTSFIPCQLITAIWFGVGAGVLLAWAARPRRFQPWLQVGTIVCLCAIPLYAGLSHLPRAVRERQQPAVAALLDQPLASGAVIAGDWPYVSMLQYYQRVESRRPDLWVIHSDLAGVRRLMQRSMTEGVPFYALRSTGAGLRLLPIPACDAAAITHPADVCLSPAVRWRGYDLATETPRSGETLPITLYWQADTPVGQDWTTFIHLVDANGEKVAQVDHAPLGDYYPPSQWQPGQLLADQYELPLGPNLQPGRYRLIFGWYAGDDRLAWCDGQDARTLAEITVGPAGQ